MMMKAAITAVGKAMLCCLVVGSGFAAAQGIKKDKSGYVTFDPAVEAFLKDKDAYYSTDNELYRSLLRGFDYKPYMVYRVVLDKTPESLKFTLIEQSKRPGEVLKSNFEFNKVDDTFYENEVKREIAVVKADGSFLLCNSLHGELLSKDEAAVTKATAAAVLTECKEHLAKLKETRNRSRDHRA